MRVDLLDARAAVDWAIAQVPVLQKNIGVWRQNRPYTVEIETKSEPTEKRYRLTSITPLYPIIDAEIGVIVHSIRSSLDLLACTLAERNGFPESTNTYFPIWKDKADFSDPKSSALEKIKRLSAVDQNIIKGLSPYDGGNQLLFALHKLDLTRKHRRLLKTYVIPRSVHVEAAQVTVWGNIGPVVWDAGYLEKKPVVAHTAPSLPDCNVSVTMKIAFNEPNLPPSQDFSITLSEFARLANSIIDLFDGR